MPWWIASNSFRRLSFSFQFLRCLREVRMKLYKWRSDFGVTELSRGNRQRRTRNSRSLLHCISNLSSWVSVATTAGEEIACLIPAATRRAVATTRLMNSTVLVMARGLYNRYYKATEREINKHEMWVNIWDSYCRAPLNTPLPSPPKQSNKSYPPPAPSKKTIKKLSTRTSGHRGERSSFF